MIGEIWKDIPSCPGYQASSEGRLINGLTGKLINQFPHWGRHGKAYLKTQLGHGKNKRVHRLICEAFHGPEPFEKAQVCHLDDDGVNNKADNLRWGTHLTNQHGKKCGNCVDAFSDHDEDGVCQVEGCLCIGWELINRKQEMVHEDSAR